MCMFFLFFLLLLFINCLVHLNFLVLLLPSLLTFVVSQFTSIHFVMLHSCYPQCEVKLAQKRGRLESNLSGGAGEDEEGDDGGDSDSDEESSAKARYFGYIKQGLYYVTEMERFTPPRKRPRTVIKNYRLVSLRSTTPEELYQRKVGA